jgi:Uma2 family endonuclease
VAEFEAFVGMGHPKRMTYADLDRTPEGDGQVYELLDGTLYASPRPRGAHARLQAELIRVLERSLRHHSDELADSWYFEVEPELRLGGDALVPDLAAWRTPDPPLGSDGYAASPPPWVCEVLSPSNLRLDWSRKLPVYFRHGVQWVWLLEPRLQELHVLEATGPGERFEGAPAEPIHPQPFDVPFDLGRLWMRLPGTRG